jgi:hypothetical protein
VTGPHRGKQGARGSGHLLTWDRKRTAERRNGLGKPTLTGRPDWLVFGEVQQWRAKTAEDMGDQRRPFRLFLRAFAGLLPWS